MLDESLIKQFVKATNDKAPKQTENMAYGEVIFDAQGNYIGVQFDGSDLVTPCVRSVNVDSGDRVLVHIKNRQAIIIANITNPSINVSTLWAEKVVIGKVDDSHVEISGDGMSVYNNVPTECFHIGASNSTLETAKTTTSTSDEGSAEGDAPLSATAAWADVPADTVDRTLKSVRVAVALAGWRGTTLKIPITIVNTSVTVTPGATYTLTQTYLYESAHSSHPRTRTATITIGYSSNTITASVSVIEDDTGLPVASDPDHPFTLTIQGTSYTTIETAPAPTLLYGSLASGGSIGGFSAGIGDDVNPSGDYSAAIGQGVTAASDNQIAVGRYNDNDPGNIFEVGNGTSSSPSNAFAVNSDGTAVFGNPAGTFSISSHVVSNGASITAGGVNSGTTNISKSGYYPIGVVGYTSSSRYGVPTSFRISGAAVGSGTLNWAIYNPSDSAKTPTCTMYVLWVKVT